MGIAWGQSNWTAGPGLSGSTNLFAPIDTFDEGGSWFIGLQGGYNYVLPNRILLGAEVDASFPSFQTLSGISIGGISNFTSPTLGAVSYSETVLSSGTVRGRIGYAPGSWLFYATGGFAWTYNQQSLTQLSTGNSLSPFLWRLGWTAGAGVEVPIVPRWTARLEYLFTDYGTNNKTFFGTQPFNSDFQLQELRLGLNYQFGSGAVPASAPILTKDPAAPAADILSLHGQSTFVYQGYPTFRSPYEGAQSLPGVGNARETFDISLFATCGCGRARSFGSIQRLIKATVLETCTAWPGSRAANPTSLASTILTRAPTAILSGKPSISAARHRRSMPTSTYLHNHIRRTVWC